MIDRPPSFGAIGHRGAAVALVALVLVTSAVAPFGVGTVSAGGPEASDGRWSPGGPEASGGYSIAPGPSHIHPGWNSTVLYVEAELVELDVMIPAPEGGWVDGPEPDFTGPPYVEHSVEERKNIRASSLYGGAGTLGSENPDYLVVLGFEHEGGQSPHEDIGGTAWVHDYEDDFADSGSDDHKKSTHRLFSEPAGIDVFTGESGGHDTGDGEERTDTWKNRFLLAGEDGYAHVHCGPPQPMHVDVAIYEIDKGTGWEAASVIGGVLASPLPTPVPGIVATALIEDGGNPDYIGEGEGYLNENGITRIEITYNQSNDPNYIPTITPEDAYLRGGLQTESGFNGEQTGVLRFRTRTVPLEEVWDEVPLQDAYLEESREDLSNAYRANHAFARCFDEQGLAPPGRGPGRIVSDPPETVGGTPTETPTPTHTLTPTPTPTETPLPDRWEDYDGPYFTPVDEEDAAQRAAYYRSLESATALALTLRDEQVPVDRVPSRFRGLVADQRANVHVGETTMGVETSADGAFDRLVLGGFDDPSLRVTTDPETAREIADADDPAAVAYENLRSGDVSYRGVGVGNRVGIAAMKAGIGTYRFAVSVDRRMSTYLPSRYDVARGDRKTITYQGEQAVLARNSLGVRTIDTHTTSTSGIDTMVVVNEHGVRRGVTTRGTQRLIDARSPSGWAPFSSPNAGVYSARAQAAVAQGQGGIGVVG